MSRCDLSESPDIELYFYGELADADRARVDAHLPRCEACRQRLEDLYAIRRALAARPVVEAPPAGDWSGFTRRLDAALGIASADSTDSPAGSPASSTYSVAYAAAAAAVILLAASLGIFYARGARQAAPAPRQPTTLVQQPASTADSSLREVTAEHLERSKLVVLGLTALDPKQTHAADWQYERQLAGTLLDDTRLYRQAAQERGLSDVARVMRDLETVLIETSMSDSSDRDALARVQRLIAKRDLVVKMQLVATN